MTFGLAFFFLGVPVGACVFVLIHTRKLLTHVRDVIGFNRKLLENYQRDLTALSLLCTRQAIRIDQLNKRIAKLDGDPL